MSDKHGVSRPGGLCRMIVVLLCLYCCGSVLRCIEWFSGIQSKCEWCANQPARAGNQPRAIQSGGGGEARTRKKGRCRVGGGESEGARHFDRVVVIVLENGDYETARQDKNLAALAAQGASFSNFHALFHPSYPNYLAMDPRGGFWHSPPRTFSRRPASQLSRRCGSQNHCRSPYCQRTGLQELCRGTARGGLPISH